MIIIFINKSVYQFMQIINKQIHKNIILFFVIFHIFYFLFCFILFYIRDEPYNT